MQRADCYQWITSRRLIEDTRRFLAEIPACVDAVVGVARSGLIPAALIAAERHVPLFSASRCHVVPVGAGFRLQDSPPIKDVLIVDDTACAGRQMAGVRLWVAALFPSARIWTAVIYATPRARKTGVFDLVAVELDSPHYLEWNFFNSSLTCKAAMDFDGILCQDCPAPYDDDAEHYANFLANVPPKHLPRREPVGAIVTGRLEKYRPETEAWLAHWGVRCNCLIMGPWPTPAARSGRIAAWKGDVYRQLPHSLFVESDPRQVAVIATVARKPVLCPVAERVFFPGEEVS